jgi:hypothetical protein
MARETPPGNRNVSLPPSALTRLVRNAERAALAVTAERGSFPSWLRNPGRAIRNFDHGPRNADHALRNADPPPASPPCEIHISLPHNPPIHKPVISPNTKRSAFLTSLLNR